MPAATPRFSISRVRHLQGRATRLLARLHPHFPLTVAGLAVLAMALLALQGFGYRRMDLVVFALTVCALSIVTFSVVMVTVTGLVLRRRLRHLSDASLPACQAEAGFPNETGFRLPALTWLPLMTLEWCVVVPDGFVTRNRINPDDNAVDEEITPWQRCRTSQLVRLFTLRDVLGLCRFSWRQSQALPLQVLPQTGRLRHLPVLRSMESEDGIPNPAGRPEGDRMDIRRYAAGDSVRDIMWRVYARNRHLNVRLAERSVFHTDRTLAYLVTGDADEAAAGVARFALTQGAIGAPWVFGADGSDDTATTLAAALPLIAGSRRDRDQRVTADDGLDRFLARQGSGQCACIVFAPATPGPWTARLQRTLQSSPGPFSVVFSTDGINDEQRVPWWQTLALADRARAGGRETQTTATVRQLMLEFHKLGAHVVMVDRQTGLSFDQHLKRV
ncbi:MAG: hypothetical protein CMQ34_02595 [Gammaproteobacteria bacterium]|nr:hypothetical protein [Gammaproteobacteria bacterium]